MCINTELEGAMSTVRWNVAVSPDLDQSVRLFIAAQGGGRKGDLSRFIEEAVRADLLERAVELLRRGRSILIVFNYINQQ
jgi:hypothetical protein